MMFPSAQDVYTVPRGPVATLWAATAPQALWLQVASWLRRRMVAARWRRQQAQAEQARTDAAAREACALEGACMEFQLIELDGCCFGALYLDGKLNCLLPTTRRL